MSRRIYVAVAVFAVTLGCAASARAVVLVNDTWKDGTRSDPASPTYTESGIDLDHDGDIESTWYRGGAGSGNAFLDPVGPGGPLRLDLLPNPTIQSSVTTYFAPEASPVTLGVGDHLKITFVFTPTLVVSDNTDQTTQSFRIGVMDTSAAARISTDVSPVNSTYSGYATFINMDRPNFNALSTNPFQLRERGDPTTAAAALSTASAWTALGNGATNGNPSFATGTQYTYTFEATHTAAGELDLLSRMTGTGLDGDGVAEVSYLDATPNGGSFSFDTFTFRLSSGNSTMGVMDISLFRVEVISAAVPLLGDVNHDGIVNGQDIALVSANWLHTGDGDVNSDGIVNGQDIAIISANWLATSGPGNAAAQAVPEPSSLVLVVLGLACSGMHLFRRRRTAR
jgi:hypothetical protein